MRITRSTLRRLIAEESARLLREAAFPEEIEAQYGRGREGEEEGEEERGTRMLHVTSHGGSYEGGEGFSNVHFIVTDYDANPLGEEAEDVTDEITGGEDLDTVALAYAIKDWLFSHTDVGYVVDEEMHDPETDDNSTVDEYIEHLDGLIASQEEEAGERGAEMYGRAVDRGDYGDLDEGDETDDDYYGDDDPFGDDEAIEKGYEYVPGVGYKKPGDDSWADIDLDTFSMGEPVPRRALVKRVEPNEFDLEFMGGEEEEMDLDEGDYGDKTDPYERGEGTYGKRARREEIGLTSISMIWDPTGEIGLVKNNAQADDINYNADLELPDPDRTRPIHQTILGKPGFKPVAELYIDLEYGRTNMDTKVQATIETDDGQTFIGTGRTAVAAIKQAEAQWRDASGSIIKEGEDDDSDNDPGARYTTLPSDSDGPDQYDPDADDLEAQTDRERERLSAYSFWGDEPGSSLKASHSDFDAHRGADMGVRRFITRGRQGKPHRVSDDGLSIDSGEDDLSESRWAKLAGILKG